MAHRCVRTRGAWRARSTGWRGGRVLAAHRDPWPEARTEGSAGTPEG
ncbi:MAG: hypothetical protein ACK52I_04045 [Pseudomonadota bacterium]